MILILNGCATNEHDAAIAESAASIERTKEESYAKGIAAASQPKVLVRIDGEIRCSQEMISAQKCGTTFYNPNTQSVIPQRDKNWVDGVQAVGDTLVRGANALMPMMLAREVTNIVKEVGNSAGGNSSVVTTNTDSGNVTSGDVKTAGVDLLDNASAKDMSDNSSVVTTNTDDNSTNDSNNSAVDDNSVNDSNNTTTDDNSSVTNDTVTNNETVAPVEVP